ncbi:2-hydroxyacid dehydrogenase [Paraburkholderia acidiphila]|uniref:2-hydroxyacid dehydrogenase n=1 Tax=Paraburkholderia acidiphila TaxID=2571747 RepID=A0A7Z2JD92_9BURK|nr:2-hydroxyacid dehydrogenase [Paraburkholderia acidiphila]QGZ59708.1 2-hydroxyacid dehydrogenase [Paraburkholderia acidiphila]
MAKPIILNAAELPERTEAELASLFTMLDLPKAPEEAAAFLAQHGASIRGIALRKTKIDAAFLDALPALEIIASYSAGLDNLDVRSAQARGIRIENASHVLAEDVANTAMGLALALTRDIVQADGYVRSGKWPEHGALPLGRSISRMNVGIVGLGMIGAAIAKRLKAFGSQVAYYGPNRKNVDLPYYDDVARLAADSDMLILTCPLTPQTHHLVNAAVIDALGPQGFLINIARGPVVDEKALIAALDEKRIAGAALDVFEHEPYVPQALIDNPRVVLTPHIGSATEETRTGMADNVVDMLASHFGIASPRSTPALAQEVVKTAAAA